MDLSRAVSETNQFKSNQVKFINIHQQMVKSTHVKKEKNEQGEDITTLNKF